MKTYKIVMMNKQEIQIDAEEVLKVVKAISTSSPAILKQAIFNPSSYSHIIEDNSRCWTEKTTDEFGHYNGTKTHYEELPDIFEGIKELAELKSAEIKKLERQFMEAIK